MTQSLPLNRRSASLAIAGAAGAQLFPGFAQAASDPALRLRRGVNLSHWFAQPWEKTSPAHFRDFVSAAAIRALAAANMTHVRFCIDPGLLFASEGPAAINEDVYGFAMRALDTIAANGLAAVFDVHPVGKAKNVLETQFGADRFVQNWRLLAARLRERAPSGLFLEVLNEPSPLEGDAWWDLQGRAVAAIRAAGARNSIIVNAGAYSGMDALAKRTPYREPDLIYTVHCYEPILFTHQGTDWSWDVARRVAGLGWPEAPAQAGQVADAATTDAEAKGFVAGAVANGEFTRSAMVDRAAKLKRWQTANGNPQIYVGEFGAYAKSAPLQARLEWLRSARLTFEGHGWGWCVWDGSSDFGFYRHSGRPNEIDVRMLEALGLSA